jgi:hypothetical protein
MVKLITIRYKNTLHITEYTNAAEKGSIKQYVSNKIGSISEWHDELHGYIF